MGTGQGTSEKQGRTTEECHVFYKYHVRFIPAQRLTSLPPVYASRHFLTVRAYFDVSSDYTLVFVTLPRKLLFTLSCFAGSY